jgi:hypothetical protein
MLRPMRQDLAVAGKWLAGTGGTLAGLYLIGTVTTHVHEYYPYAIFGGMVLLGIVLVLRCSAPLSVAATGPRLRTRAPRQQRYLNKRLVRRCKVRGG